MNKFKALAIHFFISLAVVTTIITLMLTFWYPHAYFKLMGGAKLLYLIGGVDVFIGPLLTFVVFKTGKKSLRFDLTVIAMLQVGAMSYGLYVMFEARPIFTVFNIDRFYVESVVDIVPSELSKAKTHEWRTASITGPRLVAIGLPKDYENEEDKKLVFVLGNTVQNYPKVYQDYAKNQQVVIKVGRSLNELIAINHENKKVIDSFLKKMHRPMTDFLYLPMYSAVNQMSAVVDSRTGELLEIIDAKPTK